MKTQSVSQRGFSLIELMIVVAIVAILAGVAYPAYQNSVQKGRRADAKAALLDAAALQEKYYFQNNQYTSTVADVGGSTSPEGYYTISLTRPCGDGSCFTLKATATGAQAADSDCASLSLTHTGAKSALDSNGTDSTSKCW